MNDGGPAFPLTTDVNGTLSADFPGMSLRDYFAAKAMQTVINDSWRMDQPDTPYSDLAGPIASDAYTIADAMIAERNKTK